MVAFLALLAEATNAISAAVIVSCLLLVTVLIMRYQHGEEGVWGGSSVVRVNHRPVQVAVQKLFVPYTLTLARDEEACGPDSSPPCSSMTRVQLRCGAVGRGVLVRWWWGVQRDALLDLLHAPWWRHHAAVCDSSALEGCSGSLDLDEGSHSVLLELPKERRLGLGPAPRTGYPLVVVQLDPNDHEDDQYRVGSVVSLLHVPDSACPEPTRMLYQYLKQRTGQFTLVTTLYTQANGVEPSFTMSNASEHTTSSSGLSAETPIIAPEQTSSNETKDAYDDNEDKSLSQPPTLAGSEVFDRSSPREVSGYQTDALEPPICPSSNKGLRIEDSKEDDVVTSRELQSEKDEDLEQELNPNCSKSTRSIVSDSRLLVEDVVLGEEEKRCNANYAEESEGRVLGCSSSQTVRNCLEATRDERLLVGEITHNSSDAARVSCIESYRLIDCPDDRAESFAKKSDNSGKKVNCLTATGTKTEDQSANIGNLSYGPEEGSSSAGACIAQAGAESTAMEQLTEEEDAPSVPVEEAKAEEKPFSSSDCVVCQECRTSLALLPCRHVCVCSSCFDQLMASPQQACPLCRQRVQAFFEV